MISTSNSLCQRSSTRSKENAGSCPRTDWPLMLSLGETVKFYVRTNLERRTKYMDIWSPASVASGYAEHTECLISEERRNWAMSHRSPVGTDFKLNFAILRVKFWMAECSGCEALRKSLFLAWATWQCCAYKQHKTTRLHFLLISLRGVNDESSHYPDQRWAILRRHYAGYLILSAEQKKSHNRPS